VHRIPRIAAPRQPRKVGFPVGADRCRRRFPARSRSPNRGRQSRDSCALGNDAVRDVLQLAIQAGRHGERRLGCVASDLVEHLHHPEHPGGFLVQPRTALDQHGAIRGGINRVVGKQRPIRFREAVTGAEFRFPRLLGKHLGALKQPQRCLEPTGQPGAR
jgi:hypothetical protein